MPASGDKAVRNRGHSSVVTDGTVVYHVLKALQSKETQNSLIAAVKAELINDNPCRSVNRGSQIRGDLDPYENLANAIILQAVRITD